MDRLNASMSNASKGKSSGKSGTGTASINMSSDELVAANTNLGTMRENIEGLKISMAGMQEGTEEFLATKRELAIATADYNRELKETTQNLKDAKEAQDKLKKAFGEIKDAVVGVSSKLNDVQSFARELERTGAASKELSRQAIRLGDDLRLSGVSYEEVTKATKSLVASTTDFTMMSKEMQNSLITDASLFNEVGVSTETYSKGLQLGIKAVGLSADQAADNMRALRRTALAMQVPVGELTDDYIAQEGKLAELGATGFKSFQEMARIQKVTGLEMGKLIQMTDKFDTFEGAAESAGSLNAALGGNFVDSMSLMMEDDPAERFKMIRDAIEDSGVSMEDMGRKQQMFMANAAGFENVSDFAKAMSGDLSALTKESEGATGGDTVKSLEDSATLIRSQTELAANFATSLEPAYGILGDKAMQVTDDVSGGMLKVAKYANDIQKALAEMMPKKAAFALGTVEAVNEGWQKYANLIAAAGTILATFGKGLLKGAKKGFNFFKKFKDGKKTIDNSTKSLKVFKDAKGRIQAVGTKFQLIDPKDLGRMQKLSLRFQAFKKTAFSGFTKIASKAKALGPAAKAGLGKLGPMARVAGGRIASLGAKVTGIGAMAVGSVVNMGYEAMKGVNAAMDAGGDMKDKIGAGLLGAGKGAAEAIDFLTGGLLDKLSTMTNSLGMGFNEAWEKLDFAFIGETFEYMFDSAIQAVKDLLGISSPSKVMMDIGSSMIEGITSMLDADTLIAAAQMMVDALLFPFTSLGSLLMDLVTGAFDLVPDSIKSFMGFETDSTSDTATKLAGATTGGVAAKTGATAGNNNSDPYVINLAMNLDGKEIDKKVINVVGGIAKQATL